MRLNTQLVEKSAAIYGPFGRTLILSDLELISLDNLSITLDSFSCLNLSNNRITHLRCDSVLKNLRVLLLMDNHIENLESLAKSFPGLEDLNLVGNNIRSLEVLERLKDSQSLKRIYLAGNPVAENPNLRPFLAARLTSLKVVDFQKVTSSEVKVGLEKFGINLALLGFKDKLKLVIEKARSISEIKRIENLIKNNKLTEEELNNLLMV